MQLRHIAWKVSWSSASEVTFYCCCNTPCSAFPLWSLCPRGHHDPTEALRSGGGVSHSHGAVRRTPFLRTKAPSECRGSWSWLKGRHILCHAGTDYPWRPLLPRWVWAQLLFLVPHLLSEAISSLARTSSLASHPWLQVVVHLCVWFLLSLSLSQLSALTSGCSQICGGDVVWAWFELKSARLPQPAWSYSW